MQKGIDTMKYTVTDAKNHSRVLGELDISRFPEGGTERDMKQRTRAFY